VTDADCRDIQDLIISVHCSNASVPDWFDDRRRNAYQTMMRQSTDDYYIEPAIAADWT
jgi:hypothetical protein